MTVGEFWTHCVLLALEAGCVISSDFRTVDQNVGVGGAKYSWHMLGLGVDFTSFPDALSRKRLIYRAQRIFPYMEDEGDHVHVQGVG